MTARDYCLRHSGPNCVRTVADACGISVHQVAIEAMECAELEVSFNLGRNTVEFVPCRPRQLTREERKISKSSQ